MEFRKTHKSHFFKINGVMKMMYFNLRDGGRALKMAFGTLVFVGLLLISTSIAQIPPPSGGGGSSGGGGGINGSVAYGPMTWNTSNFPAFVGNETLSVLSLVGTENRVIAENNLEYLTWGQQEPLKVVKEKYTSAEAAAAAGLERFGDGQMAPNAGNYTI
ncbi:MAG: hypothetical protein LUQ20_06485, partial [Candidatus Methanoperedens sp.]|nr:hypothetical protein [Candidatus Methanoperedens sp.]